MQQPQQSGIITEGTNPTANWPYYLEADLAFGATQAISNSQIVEVPPSTADSNDIAEPSITKVRKNDADSILSSIEESNSEIKDLIEIMNRQGDLMCSTVHTLVSKL